jgi:cupin fold WbuC family metalloprotein
VVLVRHVLEHAHAPWEFMQAVRTLVGAHGRIVFEVPDCTKALDELDYTTIWDEHTLYLTPETFRAALGQGTFEIEHFETYLYSNENCLAAIVRPASHPVSKAAIPPEAVRREIGRATRFAGCFSEQRAWWQSFCTRYRRERGPIALLGAGHLACTFVNLMGLHEHIDFVADDHPRKRGLFMPGSKLPIIESAALVDRNVSLCLTIMSAESEQRVLQRQQAFIARGGSLGSACPASRISVQRRENGRNTVPPANRSAVGEHESHPDPTVPFQRGRLKTRTVSPEVLFADQPFVELDRREIAGLQQHAPLNPRPRVRICTHLDDQCPLQEMFIAFTRDAYIRPHKHTHKLVSHHIIEGRADIVFFDDDGAITRVVPMGDYRSGLAFYSRASEHHYYMLIVRSDSLVVHESTQGPFYREGTLFPDWSPPESDRDAAQRYIAEITRRVDAILAAHRTADGISAAA